MEEDYELGGDPNHRKRVKSALTNARVAAKYGAKIDHYENVLSKKQLDKIRQEAEKHFSPGAVMDSDDEEDEEDDDGVVKEVGGYRLDNKVEKPTITPEGKTQFRVQLQPEGIAKPNITINSPTSKVFEWSQSITGGSGLKGIDFKALLRKPAEPKAEVDAMEVEVKTEKKVVDVTQELLKWDFKIAPVNVVGTMDTAKLVSKQVYAHVMAQMRSEVINIFFANNDDLDRVRFHRKKSKNKNIQYNLYYYKDSDKPDVRSHDNNISAIKWNAHLDTNKYENGYFGYWVHSHCDGPLKLEGLLRWIRDHVKHVYMVRPTPIVGGKLNPWILLETRKDTIDGFLGHNIIKKNGRPFMTYDIPQMRFENLGMHVERIPLDLVNNGRDGNVYSLAYEAYYMTKMDPVDMISKNKLLQFYYSRVKEIPLPYSDYVPVPPVMSKDELNYYSNSSIVYFGVDDDYDEGLLYIHGNECYLRIVDPRKNITIDGTQAPRDKMLYGNYQVDLRGVFPDCIVNVLVKKVDDYYLTMHAYDMHIPGAHRLRVQRSFDLSTMFKATGVRVLEWRNILELENDKSGRIYVDTNYGASPRFNFQTYETSKGSIRVLSQGYEKIMHCKAFAFGSSLTQYPVTQEELEMLYTCAKNDVAISVIRVDDKRVLASTKIRIPYEASAYYNIHWFLQADLVYLASYRAFMDSRFKLQGGIITMMPSPVNTDGLLTVPNYSYEEWKKISESYPRPVTTTMNHLDRFWWLLGRALFVKNTQRMYSETEQQIKYSMFVKVIKQPNNAFGIDANLAYDFYKETVDVVGKELIKRGVTLDKLNDNRELSPEDFDYFDEAVTEEVDEHATKWRKKGADPPRTEWRRREAKLEDFYIDVPGQTEKVFHCPTSPLPE